MKQIRLFLVVFFCSSIIPAICFGGGQCAKGNCQNGKGTFVYDDGSQYVGEWRQGKKHGLGIFKSISGNTYKGEWKEGMRHGKGMLFDRKDSMIKQGYWKYGMWKGDNTPEQ